MATTIHSALQYIKFEFAHKRIQQKIDKLDPQKDNFHSEAQNASKKISRLYAQISSTNPLQDSTRIQTLAYFLDKKVSTSKLADSEKKLFSANLQHSANSRFNSLDKDIIREIVKHLKDKESVFSLAQVNKCLNLQINKFRLQRIEHKLSKQKKTPNKQQTAKISRFEGVKLKYLHVILKNNFQSILSRIENLTTEELDNNLILNNIYTSITKINQEIIATPLLSAEFSLLTNHLLYTFETKLKKAPESSKAELSKRIWQAFPLRLNDLPKDILIEIFNHLDIYTINKLKETCKSFNTIIKTDKKIKSKLIAYITLMIEHTNCLIDKKKMAVLTAEMFNGLLTNEGFASFNDDTKSENEKIKKLEMTVKKYEQFLLKEKQQN